MNLRGTETPLEVMEELNNANFNSFQDFNRFEGSINKVIIEFF
eukprot:UN21501